MEDIENLTEISIVRVRSKRSKRSNLGLYSQRARKNRDPPPPRTNRAGVQKEGEKGKTTTTTLTTTLTTTSLVVVCVFKTLSQTRGDSKRLFFQTSSFGGGPFQTREARQRFESEKDKASEDVVREEGRALRLRAWYARFFSRVFSGRVDRDTHTPEREKDSYFFLGLCTDYIPLSCLYRESNQKHVVEEEEEKKPTTPQEENCATTNSICNCNTNHGGGNHHERR